MINQFKFLTENKKKSMHGQTAYDYYGRQENNISNIEIWTEAYMSAQRGNPINNYPLYLNERQRVTFNRAFDYFKETINN